jgi:hypothetical protein
MRKLVRSISIVFVLLAVLAPVYPAQTATPSGPNTPQDAKAAPAGGNTSLASPQKEKTGLEGTVTDTSGAVVVGATVIVRSAAGETKTTVTGGDGTFRIAGLTPGKYDVSVTMEGFTEFKRAGVDVAAGAMTPLDVQLQLATAATQVNVQAQRAEQIETENAEVSGTITRQEITMLGLNGRNFSTLIALAPGVSNQTGQDEAKVGVVGSAKYSVNGGRTEYNTFDVDGNDVLNPDIAASHGHATLLVYPSLDAIQEMKVLTSNYGALYGRTASGTVLVVTKSGGASYHGVAYEFLRNEVFNARNFFDPPGGAPLYRRNDFGFTVGGPLYIPHVFKQRAETTFFLSEEYRAERSPFEFNQAVPTDAMRGYNLLTQSYAPLADFSQVCPAVSSFVTFSQAKYPDCPGQGQATVRQTFLGNQIPIDPVAAAILQSGLIPRANSTTGCNSTVESCYVTTVSPPTSYREDLLKIDHNVTSNTKLTLSGVHDHWTTTTSVPQWENQPNSFPTVENSFLGPGAAAQVHLTSVISPTFLNDYSFGVTWQRIFLDDIPGAGVSLSRAGMDSAQFPMGYLFDNGFGGKIPGIFIGGNNAAYGGAGFTVDTSFMPWYHGRGTLGFRDGLSKVHGPHTLQVGVQYIEAMRHEVNAANGANSGNVQGVLNYRNTGNASTTGNAFADFILGYYGGAGNPPSGAIETYQQDNTQSTYKVRYQIVEPYVQDDWHATPRLVVNLGLRLSLFGNWQPEDKDLPVFNWQASTYDPTVMPNANAAVNWLHGNLMDATSEAPLPLDVNNLSPVLTNGLVQCGKNRAPASCQSSHLFNPAPRIGFAWDPLGKGKTSIRAGYGIFFEHGTGSEANVGSLMGNPPQVLSMQESYPNGLFQIGKVPGSQPGTAVAYPLNLVSIPAKGIWPYAQQWSVGVEQEIARDTMATLSYVGSKGTHLAIATQPNQLHPVSAANNPFGPGVPLTAAFCQQGNIDRQNPSDPANYFTLSNGSLLYYNQNPSAVLGLIAACNGTPGNAIQPPISFDLNVLRPYQGIGSITSITDVATSSYNSMQVTLRRSRGPLDLAIAYTYGHSLDTASDRYESNFVDAYNLRANRANSDFDQRHLLNISYIYKLRSLSRLGRLIMSSDEQLAAPYEPSKLARRLFDGWQVSGITTFQSGTPFNVVNGASRTGISVLDNGGLALGLNADSYPDVVHNLMRSGTCFNIPASDNVGTFGPLLKEPCQFVAPRGLTQGNAGRNFLNNPSRTNFDVALIKDFKTWHESSLQFRAEAFNVFNHTQFNIYDPIKGNTGSNTISCYGDSTTNYSAAAPECMAGNGFLHPVDAHRPRTLQFGLKLQF